ncbi:hypothetical protein [Paraburkholderia solisilvae]|uniref:Uncharacterized protein n=1 Tax=Paraburkholderia solisilvae TaxID=624376 RepID=A0A6J5DFC3_9BURK|nr:hypothetical protein [Paraburkholderia solisilvae]CAB3751685.1 hypothetical protein LMG29739_01357 [Paraburkholderia solisilvae]
MAPNFTVFSGNRMLALAVSVIAASLWFAAVVAAPEFQRAWLSVIAVCLAVPLLLLRGAWQALRHTSLTAARRMRTWMAIAIPLALWLGSVWVIAAKGLLLPGVIRFPLLPLLIVVPTAIAVVVLRRSLHIGKILDVTPVAWLIGIQSYRVVGAVFFLGWTAGSMPGVFAWPAGIGDVITGVMAFPVAAAIASGQSRSVRAAVIWNVFGLGDLILAILLGALTSPGPLQYLHFDPANLGIGAYPYAIIPAFIVPGSFLLHILSLRQLLRKPRFSDSIAPVAMREADQFL